MFVKKPTGRQRRAVDLAFRRELFAVLACVILAWPYLHAGRSCTSTTSTSTPPNYISVESNRQDVLSTVDCTADTLNSNKDLLSKLQDYGQCQLLTNICWSQGKLVVAANRTSQIQKLVSNNGRHIYNPIHFFNGEEDWRGLRPEDLKQQAIPSIKVRAQTSEGEHSASIRKRSYSTCTIPLIVYPYDPWNYGSFMAKTGSWLHNALDGMRPVFKKKLQICIVTPDDLALPSFAKDMLQPLVDLPVKSFADASANSLTGPCFQEMLVCSGTNTINLWQYGQRLAAHHTGQQVTAAPGTQQKVLRIGFAVVKQPGKSKIENVPALVEACSTATLLNYKLRCSTVEFHGDIASHAKFLQDIDVLITSHNDLASYAFMLSPEAAVIDIIPLDMLRLDYAERNLEDSKSQLLWWNLYVCNAEYAERSSLEKEFGQPRGLMPSLRSSRLPWDSIQTVLKAIIKVDKNVERYRHLAQHYGHSFFALANGTRAATLEEPRYSCPTTSEETVARFRDRFWSGPYPKTKNFSDLTHSHSGVDAIWQVPPFPSQDVLIVLNGALRPNKEWFPESVQCPHCCKTCYMHHRLTVNTALSMRMTVIALQNVYKQADVYPGWMPYHSLEENYTSPENITDLQRGGYDSRPDPLESLDLPKLRRTIHEILKTEELYSPRIFVAGFSAGGAAAFMLPLVMPQVQGLLVLDSHSAGLQPYLELLKEQNRQHPPVAWVYQPLNVKYGPYIKHDLESLRNESVPTLALTSWPSNPSPESLSQWLKVNASTAEQIMEWFYNHKLIDRETKEAAWLNWTSNAITRLATLLRDVLNVPGFGEWLYHSQGFHYLDCTYSRELLQWLQNGGLDTPRLPQKAFNQTHPLYRPARIVDVDHLPDGTPLP